ncbi:MAG: cytochrome c family protein [Xanthobacteraceae bacterium]
MTDARLSLVAGWAVVGLTVVVVAQTASVRPAAAQDATKGKQVFNMCAPCHSIGPGAANKVGPELNGLDGRHSGTVANFSYSDANKNSGVVWSEATFKQYIKSPGAMIPGTKMPFAGIKNQQEVNDLWAYISQFDAQGNVKK